MSNIVILGAGVMGSAMCLPARDRGHAVRLVGTHLDRQIVDALNATGRHPRLNVALPEGVSYFHHDDLAAALGEDTDLVVLGVSSAGVDWAIDRLCDVMAAPLPVVMITKGMHAEPTALIALPDRLQREIRRRTGHAIAAAAIGGPCIAGELAVRRHTGTVIAARDEGFAADLCALLETGYYHPRPSPDLMGVEICAAFKNFYAIAVGWAAGMLQTLPPTDNRAFNHNAAAAVFGQAVAEMMALVAAFGGSAASVWGMAGAGDLYVTSMAGRNSRLGNNLGRGLTYRQARDGPMQGDTVEGAELGLAVAPTLRAMMRAGTLDPARLPLACALLDALTEDRPLDIRWLAFHRIGG